MQQFLHKREMCSGSVTATDSAVAAVSSAGEINSLHQEKREASFDFCLKRKDLLIQTLKQM